MAGSSKRAASTDVPSTRTTRPNSNTDQEPPAKRPKLKLNLRKPSSNDGDTIAVSRPRRESATRSSYSEDAVMLDDEVEEVGVKQSPSASSGLSSPISVTASVRSGVLKITQKFATRPESRGSSEDALPAKTKQETRHEARQSYGDFMSYYVADGDDDEEVEESRKESEDEEEAGEEAAPAPKPKRQPAKAKPAAKEKQPRQSRKKQVSAPLAESASTVTSKPSPVDRAPTIPRPRPRENPPPQRVRTPGSRRVNTLLLPLAPPLPSAQSSQRPPPAQGATHPPDARQHLNGMQPSHTTQYSKPMPYTLLAEEITVKYHASVDVKVKKLQTLSTCLMNFGGVPPAKRSPAPENGKKPEESKNVEVVKMTQNEKEKTNGDDKAAPVDNFLAMFDDESEDERESDSDPKRVDSKDGGPTRDSIQRDDIQRDDIQSDDIQRDNGKRDNAKDDDPNNSNSGDRKSQDQVEQNRYLEHTGVPDGPLTYGIQFIMDALHSWAEQRIRQQRQQHMVMIQARMLPPALPSSDNTAVSHNKSATLNGEATPKLPDLSDTPEGQAITAFRDVVESGCLQVNLILPADLARAVSHLYLQIDHLINQGNRTQQEPPYHPVTYASQAIAHQKRLDRFRDEQARRQQALAQQGLHPMYGMAPQPMLNGFPQHLPFQNQMYAPPAGRRRSTPQVPGQPQAHLPPRVSLPAGTTEPLQSPANGNVAGNSSTLPGAPRQDGLPVLSKEERVRMMNAANLRLPRSGQMMNFSFAHDNPAALQAFGKGSFPTTKQAPGATVPSQPMVSPTVVTSSPAPLPTTEPPVPNNGTNNIKSERASRGPSDTDAHAHPSNPSPGFTAVNAPAKPARASRTPATKPKTPGDSHSDAMVLDDD